MSSPHTLSETLSAASGAQEDDEISLLDLALVVAENLKLLVVGPLLVGLATLGVTFVIAPTFTAKTVILPPQQQQSSAAAALQSLGALAGLAGAAGAVKSPADQYIAMMQSDSVLDRMIETHDLKAVYKKKFKVDTRKALIEKSRITSGKKDGLIVIEVDDTDPARAAAIANDYVDQLRRLNAELAVTEAQQRRLFFERQLEQTSKRLAEAQKAIQGAGINEGAIRAEPRAAAAAYGQLKAEVTAAEVRLQSMRSYLTDSAPEVQQILSTLVALRAQLAKAEGSNPEASSGDYINRFREFKYQETLFELFARQYELARVDESREGPLVQVVDAAVPPERKSKPKRGLTAVIATLAAGFALLLWVFVRQALRNASRNSESAAKIAQIKGLLLGRRST